MARAVCITITIYVIAILLLLLLIACSRPERFREDPRRDWCGDARKSQDECR